MPNGGLYGEHYPERSIEEQAKDLREERNVYKDAFYQAKKLVESLISENRQIRKLAKLPEETYPTGIIVDNHHFSFNKEG